MELKLEPKRAGQYRGGEQMDAAGKTEDDIAREKLGPQGVPGKPDTHPAPGTKEREQLPERGEFDGHTA